ncbi:reticulon-4-interacting protein 1 homolog, mitochondrial-like isoform X4 [Bacillus rossius redtenbacheri]|uniref:reticulon-4-interacting protein 1 homolog, mitochondrial-like isoform X4 n=1 Tax=Bacillus rossius redtenbacheri TaxID=93214 RepID=UPI002FDE93FD
MDELLFHLSQRLDSLQVHLSSWSQHGRVVLAGYVHSLHALARDVWAGRWGASMRDAMSAAWDWLGAVARDAKRLTADLQPTFLYDRARHFLMTRTGVYFGGMGFLVGSLFGVLLGLSLHRHPPVLPRMKAVVCTAYRGLDSLAVVDDVRVPTISNPDEILVQVKATSVDSIDLKICSGYGRVLRRQLNKYNPNVDGEFPVVLGRDCAGVVLELGQAVKRFEVGDEVWLAVPHWSPGTMSECVVVKEGLVAKKPGGIGFEVAASLPYAGSIAWNAMVRQAHLDSATTRGKRILVHGGCSPVGCVLIQLARLWGATVTATCALRATPVVQALGADDVVVTGVGNLEKQLASRESFDVIFNTAGVMAHKTCLKFCQPDGLVVTTLANDIASDEFGFVLGSLYALWVKVRLLAQSFVGSCSWGTIQFGSDVLDHLGALVEDGSIQPVVDKIFTPQDAELAFQHTDSEDAIGKTIIRFRSRIMLKNRKPTVLRKMSTSSTNTFQSL